MSTEEQKPIEIPPVSIDIEKLLENSKVQIANAIERQVAQSAASAISWKVNSSIDAVVKAFMEEQIAPQVKAHLEQQKVEIMRVIAESTAKILVELGNGMVKKATDRFGNTYNFEKILKAIYGD